MKNIYQDDVFIDQKTAVLMMDSDQYAQDKPLHRCGNCGDVTYETKCTTCGKNISTQE